MKIFQIFVREYFHCSDIKWNFDDSHLEPTFEAEEGGFCAIGTEFILTSQTRDPFLDLVVSLIHHTQTPVTILNLQFLLQKIII